MTKCLYLCSVTDHNYVIPTCVTVSSVCLNNPCKRIIYYVIATKLTNSDYDVLLQLEKINKNLKIHFIEFSSSNKVFKYISEMINKTLVGSHLTEASYIRLFLTELLPNEVNKVLYLDSDIICQGSIEDLFDIDLAAYNSPVAGVSDISAELHKERLSLSRYINSGVLLINLAYWREYSVISEFIKQIKIQSDQLQAHDQDVINLTFRDKIHLLPKRWNYQFFPILAVSERKQIETANLAHFITQEKPWIFGNCNQMSKLWISCYENCYKHKFTYKHVFPVKKLFLNLAISTSLKFFPLETKRRRLLKKCVPSFIKKRFSL